MIEALNNAIANLIDVNSFKPKHKPCFNPDCTEYFQMHQYEYEKVKAKVKKLKEMVEIK